MAEPFETLIVKLLGDASSHLKMVSDAIAANNRLAKNTEAVSNKMKADIERASRAEEKAVERIQGSLRAEARKSNLAGMNPYELYAQRYKKYSAQMERKDITEQRFQELIAKEYEKLPHQVWMRKQIAAAIKEAEKAEAGLVKETQEEARAVERIRQALRANAIARQAVIETHRTRSADAIVLANRTPQQQYMRDLAEISRLQRRGYLDANNAALATARTRREFVLSNVAARNYGGALLQLGNQFSRLSFSMVTAGRQMSMYITAPLIGLGLLAVRSFGKFDEAMTKSVSIMGDVSTEMRKMMSDTALIMSTRTRTSAIQLAEGYYYLASAGYTAEQSVRNLGIVNDFAVAGTMDLALATEKLSDIQTVLGMRVANQTQNAENLRKVSDVLTMAANKSQATILQLASAFANKAGPAMRFLNMEIEDGAAILATYAQQGKKGATAGEAMGIALRELQYVAIKHADVWKSAGMAVFDASNKFMGMEKIVKQLEDKTQGLGDKEKAQTLLLLGFRARSLGAIQPLIGASSMIAKFRADFEKVGGATKKVADSIMTGFVPQMERLRNRVNRAAYELGEVLAPVIKALGQHLDDAIQKWRGLDDATKKQILTYASLAGAIGPVLLGVGVLSRQIGNLAIAGGLLGRATHAIGTFVTAAKGLGSTITTIPQALMAFSTPIGAVTTAVLAGAAAWATYQIGIKGVKQALEASSLAMAAFAKDGLAAEKAWTDAFAAYNRFRATFHRNVLGNRPLAKQFEEAAEYQEAKSSAITEKMNKQQALFQENADKYGEVIAELIQKYNRADEELWKSFGEAHNAASKKIFNIFGQEANPLRQYQNLQDINDAQVKSVEILKDKLDIEEKLYGLPIDQKAKEELEYLQSAIKGYEYLRKAILEAEEAGNTGQAAKLMKQMTQQFEMLSGAYERVRLFGGDKQGGYLNKKGELDPTKALEDQADAINVDLEQSRMKIRKLIEQFNKKLGAKETSPEQEAIDAIEEKMIADLMRRGVGKEDIGRITREELSGVRDVYSQIKAQEKFNKMKKEGQDIDEKFATVSEKIAKEEDRLYRLLEKGIITWEKYNKALAAYKREMIEILELDTSKPAMLSDSVEYRELLKKTKEMQYQNNFGPDPFKNSREGRFDDTLNFRKMTNEFIDMYGDPRKANAPVGKGVDEGGQAIRDPDRLKHQTNIENLLQQIAENTAPSRSLTGPKPARLQRG